MAEGVPVISRVTLENYKSIPRCNVRLGPLSILVGRNGSGKSNLLDALRFVAAALNTTLEQAVDERGGSEDMLYRGAMRPQLGITLDVTFPFGNGKKLGRDGNTTATYGFILEARGSGAFRVKSEHATLRGGMLTQRYVVENGKLDLDRTLLRKDLMPTPAVDRLYLVALSGASPYRELYDALRGMSFYHFNTRAMRELRQRGRESLASDGSNIAEVLERLWGMEPPLAAERVNAYMQAILPGLESVHGKRFGPVTGLEFQQHLGATGSSMRFHATNMSDGTLHALGVLVALFHGSALNPTGPALIGIEEPEMALHPAAIAVLRGALIEASTREQVIVTTQSADLLDSDALPPDAILAVTSQAGATQIGPLGETDRAILRDHLATAGELLRSSDFQPAVSEPAEPVASA